MIQYSEIDDPRYRSANMDLWIAPALRCYECLGFRPVGLMRRHERDHTTGEWQDGLLMELLAEELARD